MKIGDALSRADQARPNKIPPEEKISWLAYLDGLISLDVLQFDIATAQSFNYSVNSYDTDLLVPFPHDELYVLWLMHKIDYRNGEYNKAEDDKADYDALYGTYVRWIARTYGPNHPGKYPPYYLTAYAIAARQGFEGSEEDWINSLQAHVFIKFSERAPISDSDMTDTPSDWLGIAAGNYITAPEHFEDYAWVYIKGQANAALVAPIYNSAESYSEGDVVSYGESVYKALRSTSGSFNPSDWQETSAVEALRGIAGDVVRYTAQTLSEAQKTQARANINALSAAAGSVKSANIDGLAVTETKIAADAVTEGKIKNGAVTTDKLPDNAVTAAKILDGAITAGKIGYGDTLPENPVRGQLFLLKVQ